MSEGRRELFGAVAGLLLICAAVAAVLGAWRPPTPVPATAPESDFSAERAQRHVERLGRAPRPLGSAAHADARGYLLDELRRLGLEPEIHEASVVRRYRTDRFLVGRVRNVVARLPGSGGGKALALLAHYDSKPTTAGAGDALSAVATVLETLRALRSGSGLSNDLIVLFTDGEEIGLLGARAFMREHRWASDVGLVLNFEARGNRGPSPMFETRSGNLELLREFQGAVPYPYATSLSYEVYRRMPNDSDFSVFRDAGIQGLNMAFIGNLAAYHTRLDSPENLDAGSLQHQGSYALALTRHFGDRDLAALGGPSAPDGIYFNPYPWRLVVYPASWAPALATLGLLLWAGSWLLGWHRGKLRLPGVARGFASAVAAMVAGATVGWCFWWLIRTYLPVLRRGPFGQPYETAALTVGLLVLVGAVVALLSTWLRAGASTPEIDHGVWLVWTLAGLALALWLPGTSYLTVWPLLFGVAGLVLTTGTRVAGSAPLRGLVPALAAIPAAVLLAPTIWIMTQALTLSSSAAIGGLMGFGYSTLAAPLGRLHRASASVSSWLLAAVGVSILGWTVWGAGPDPERPHVTTLVYAVDSGSGEAWWASFDALPEAWTDEILGPEAVRGPAPAAFSLVDTELRLAPAEGVALSPPLGEAVAESRERGRRLEAVVRSTRDAAVLRLRAEAAVPLRSVGVEGEEFVFEGDAEAEGLGEVWITAYGFDAGGVRVMFEIEGDRPWPIELDLVDQSWGFGALPEPPTRRPPSLMPSSSWRTDAVYVRASTLL